ncbi:sigma-54-dependent Fis family transcriptional regulator [Cystobacter fuscus]|uniref:sigma-54-dependent Fis family transcriptional regulator n=1 Tax=Cystobacter fuscus TaxID=43 RepID=UPI002B29F57C|nr:FHA domain-containing protein [Cystobacter fuscus]
MAGGHKDAAGGAESAAGRGGRENEPDTSSGWNPPYREPKALRVQREGIEDLVSPLYPDRAYIFGRSPESTVVFSHEAVSRQHGRLSLREDRRWVYRDLDSKNGSYVGRPEAPGKESRVRFQRLAPSKDRVLEAGDMVLLGNGRSRLTLLAEMPQEGGARPHTTPRVSSATVQLERSIDRCARHPLPVFLRGDSGTGKTFIAREIHRRGGLEGSFVILNCGRLPQDPASLTSELLGHLKGAYTGASLARVGKLYGANGGTLFLDEVEFLPRIAQDFLVDVLEGTGSLAPLGAPADFREPPPRFRLISASKVPLRQTDLRPDLAQRLAAGDFIILPTLEERREDIPHLVATFLHRLKVEQQYDAQLTPEALDFLARANWPGQIRELESTVRTVVAREAAQQSLEGNASAPALISLEAVRSYLEQRALGFGGALGPLLMPRTGSPSVDTLAPVRKRPRALTVQDIQEALARQGGNKTRTAADLGIALNTLKARMKALGMS